MGEIRKFCALFAFVLIINFAESTKLNYPRVLLPIFDKISINFTLEVIEKGCFKWISSRQDLIKITPLYDDSESECSSRAVVTVLTREKRRNTAIVLAEEGNSGDVLRCDVILDTIDQLGVLTTTRELYLEEAPETFELWAQDSQGNAFTTLEGVEFDWEISSQNYQNYDSRKDATWQQVLRFLTFSESKYHEVPPALEKFEAIGKRGYMVLLEGINTGTAKVSVKFHYPEYSHVRGIEVYITVLANIILDPTDAHILVGDTVNFRILQLKQGKLQEISLNSQYYLEIEDESLATISGYAATGQRLGRTCVILRDRNVPLERSITFNSDSVKSPTPRATLTVTTPFKLTVNLLPHNNWVTVEGEKHEIAFDLYTRDDQKIWLGPRYNVGSQFDELIFYVLKKSQNGSRIFGEAVKEGRTAVHGFFEELTAKAEMQVFKELTLYPTRVILPFDPDSPKQQKIVFKAQGGDGSYVWSSHNSNILHISQNGIAETKIDGDLRQQLEYFDEKSKTFLTKHTNIKVALVRNTKIFKTAELFFLPPVKLEIVKYNFETALKDYVKLHIAVYAFANGSYVPFTKCGNLNFDFEFTNQIFHLDANKEKTDDEQMAPKACHLIYLKATSIGTTHLRLSYRFMDRILKDEATLIVYEKLNILNPIVNEIVLPIGASRNILYLNGPQRIFNIEAELIKIMKADPAIVDVSEIKRENSKQIYAYTVLCKKVGETVLTFEIYNSLVAKNFEPYISAFVTNVYCVKPRFLNLYATEQLRQSCPLEVKNSLMHIKERDENIEIEIEVLDAKNRRLMNISSLLIEWEFAQGDERYSKNVIPFRESEEEIVEGIRIPGKDLLSATISDLSSNFKIKGTITQYDSSVLDSYGITPEKPNFGIRKTPGGPLIKPVIENEISFQAVNTTLFPFDELSIFLARSKAERIPLAQGSGFYDFKLSDPSIVTVEYDSRTRELIIVPHEIGRVQIELIDRCLMTEPTYLTISVVCIGSIVAEIPDRVEKTKTIEGIIRLYDSNDNLLNVDYSNLQVYDLHQNIFNPAILSIRLGEQLDLKKGEIRYYVTGVELGETKIVFNSGFGDKAVTSEPVNIQVFPPLRLYPRNSTLIVGSSVQIYYHGGPRPDVNIVYSVQNQNIVSMDSALVLAKKLGNTKITGRCVGNHPTTGKQIVFSEDTVEVFIIPLEKIQIRTPLVRIKSDATMPASVWGVPDLSPMILGTLESLRVIWSTNQPDVIDIFGIFSEAGIEYGDRDLITVRVRAQNPGKAKITATVILSGGQRLSSSVEVYVFKMLELESPKRIVMDSILMAPRSTIQLKANLDDAVYKLDGESNGIVKVSPDGVVKSGDTLGRDLIIARTFEQTLPVGVEVKNVQYILASLQYPSVKLKQIEEKIPRGMNLILKVSLHDNQGNEFSHNIEDVNGIRYDLSHKDMVDIQIGNNQTVAINLPRETNNMIAISLKDSTGVKHAEDFIKVSVAESKYIFPTKTIFSVGDIICFDSPLSLSAYWTCSDERFVAVDRQNGLAKVLGNRHKNGEKITVTNGDKTGSYIKYDLEIREADKIEFFKSYDVFSGNSYRAHLVLRNHLQIDKFTNLIAKNISKCSNYVERSLPANFFTCRLTSKQQLGILLLENFKVAPLFDKEQGTYACEIELVTSFNDVMNIVKTNEINIELEAQLPNGITDIVTLKVVPGIKVTPDAISIDQIAQQGIVITGLEKVLQKVEVKPSDTSVLEVIPQAKTHGSLQYKVKLLNELPSDEQLFVHVHSPLTLQNIEVLIQGPNAMLKCSTQPFNNSSQFLINIVSNIGLIISALFVLAVSVWAIVFCFPQRNRIDVNAEAFSSFKGKSDISNISGSPVNQSELSSRGPSYPSSPYCVNKSGVSPTLSTGNESPVYGDTTLISPQRRINRRYL